MKQSKLLIMASVMLSTTTFAETAGNATVNSDGVTCKATALNNETVEIFCSNKYITATYHAPSNYTDTTEFKELRTNYTGKLDRVSKSLNALTINQSDALLAVITKAAEINNKLTTKNGKSQVESDFVKRFKNYNGTQLNLRGAVIRTLFSPLFVTSKHNICPSILETEKYMEDIKNIRYENASIAEDFEYICNTDNANSYLQKKAAADSKTKGADYHAANKEKLKDTGVSYDGRKIYLDEELYKQWNTIEEFEI